MRGQQDRLLGGLGVAATIAVFFAAAVRPESGSGVLLASVLPIGFLVCGALARVLRPADLVGRGLLLVGALHLTAFAGSLGAALLRDRAWVCLVISLLSAWVFAAGFVALLDLLARYPTGRFGWPWVGLLVRAALGVVAAATLLSVLGTARTLSPAGLDLGANPAFVPAFAPFAASAAVALLAPAGGLALLVARFRHAPAADRRQMVWPMAAATVVVAGMAATVLLERVLGPAGQTALFITAGLGFPAAFLVGLLRHSEEVERLALVASSRRRLAEATLAERQRLGRDLHDGAQQQLIALLARVEVVRARTPADEALGRDLDQIRTQISQTSRELRALAQGIHPTVVTDHGLAEAVATALARMPGEARLEVDDRVRRTRLDELIEVTAYFCVLEGLANAAKHAPGPVTVAIGIEDNHLKVTVSDSGPGFDSAEPTPGSGLAGLRDRLDAVGGRLLVDTAPGRGVRLSAVLPWITRG